MKFLNNIPKVFFGFLAISSFIWLLINFSKTYTTQIKYPVVYSNLASNKVYKKTPLQEIELYIKASGFKLFTSNFNSKKITLNLKKLQKKNNNHYFFIANKLHNSIQKQLAPGLSLQKILPDSIPIYLDVLASKKVKIKHKLNISFAVGYDIATPITITPDSILISGPQKKLDTITNISLATINLKNVSKNTNIKAPIITPKSIKHNTKEVTLNINVAKFTEGNIRVPVIITNVPNDTNLSIFPKNVLVTYKVALHNFNKINENSFEIICDYNTSKKNNSNFLIPEIKKQPKTVTAIRISPLKIDFLVNK